jgi:hypothetical protein
MIPREYLGAFKAGHRASARPFIDDELSHKLLVKVLDYGCDEARQALEYITKFNNEFYKDVFKKGESALHNTRELRKSCGDRNNSRNRDAYSLPGALYFIEDMKNTTPF